MWPRALRQTDEPKIPFSPADVPETVQAERQLAVFHRRFVAAGLMRILAGINLLALVSFFPSARWTGFAFAVGLVLFAFMSREMGRAEMAKSLQKVILEASRRQDEGMAQVVEAMTRMQEDEGP